MTKMRIKALSLLVILLLSINLGAAEPGGVGDGVYDMQCGGACHGDSDQNATSAAILILSSEDKIYAGQATTFTLQVEQLSSSPYVPIGLFLLSDSTGYRDTPQDIGWQIMSDSKGGINNYIEVTGFTEADSIEWVLRAPEVGNYTFYASIHHGGNDVPYFAISSAYTVEVLPIPDNLPRLSNDFTPMTSRQVGEQSNFQLLTEDADSVIIEWKISGGIVNSMNLSGDSVNAFMVELPTANQPSSMQWRAILSGEGPQQVTPWFTLVTNPQSFSIDSNAVYLQSLSILFFCAGLSLLIQTRITANPQGTLQKEKSFDETSTTLATQGGEL